MSIRESINYQMTANSEKIIDYHNYLINNKDLFTYLCPPILVDIVGKYLLVLDLNSSSEFKIPLIMISVLRNIRIDEFINNSIKSEYEYLIVSLYNISNNCFLYSESYRLKYWTSMGISLLNIIKDGNLSSKEFREDIYDKLGVTSRYIRYSDINNYEYY